MSKLITKGKHKNKTTNIGRPTKYTNKFPQLTREYTNKDKFPTIEGLCLEVLHVNDDQVVNYAKKYKEFNVAIKELKMKQKRFLQRGGLGLEGKIQQVMSIFLLKANHGYIETERRQLVGNDNGPITIAPVYYGDKTKPQEPVETPKKKIEDTE